MKFTGVFCSGAPLAGSVLAAVLLTATITKAEPIVVLSSLHDLDYAEVACGHMKREAQNGSSQIEWS